MVGRNCLKRFCTVGLQDDVFEIANATARISEEYLAVILFGQTRQFFGDPLRENATVDFLYLIKRNDAVHLWDELAQRVDELVFKMAGKGSAVFNVLALVLSICLLADGFDVGGGESIG